MCYTLAYQQWHLLSNSHVWAWLELTFYILVMPYTWQKMFAKSITFVNMPTATRVKLSSDVGMLLYWHAKHRNMLHVGMLFSGLQSPETNCMCRGKAMKQALWWTQLPAEIAVCSITLLIKLSANHITLHSIGSHFVSRASIHREYYRTLWYIHRMSLAILCTDTFMIGQVVLSFNNWHLQ